VELNTKAPKFSKKEPGPKRKEELVRMKKMKKKETKQKKMRKKDIPSSRRAKMLKTRT
jgi:hypothetical protein